MGIITESKMPDVDSVLRFLRSGNPQRPSVARDGKEKVTSSAPGLAPSDRLAIEKWYKQRAHTDAAVEDKEAKDAAVCKDGDRDTTNFEAQVGRPMLCDAIIARLRKLNPNFIFERSNAFPDIMGIYVADEKADVRGGERKRHIMGFEFGYSPEFSVYHKEVQGPKKVTRGWRSLIIVLAKKNLINFNDACRAFDIDSSKNSMKWKAEVDTLRRYRI